MGVKVNLSAALITILVLFLTLALVSCGTSGTTASGTTGTTSMPDSSDARINGTVLAQGTFLALNNSQVSGIVSLYALSTTNKIAIRIDGLSGIDETGVLLQAYKGGTLVFRSQLKSQGGNQNYSTTATDSSGWTQIELYSTYSKSALAIATLKY